MPSPDTTATDAPPDRKPRDDEIDVHGLTHPGKVRRDNQLFLDGEIKSISSLEKEPIITIKE